MRGYTDYMPPPGRSRSPGSVIIDIGTQWLDEHHKEDFFLFLHFWDAHIPYVPPQPYKHRYTKGSVLHRDPLVDEKLREQTDIPPVRRKSLQASRRHSQMSSTSPIFTMRRSRTSTTRSVGSSTISAGSGVLEKTMVVLFGDHGENMTEHDAWFDHAGLYDSVVHVPVLIWAPGVVPESEVTSLVSTVDIKPTVLDFLGMPGSRGTRWTVPSSSH